MNCSNSLMDKVTGYIQYKHIDSIMHDINYLHYAVIKGCPLSYYAYTDFGKRRFSDTDLLIDRKDIEIFEEILLTHGFGQIFTENKPSKAEREKRILSMRFSNQLLPYYRLINGQLICLDINFDILWSEYTGKRINISSFLSDTNDMEIYSVKIKTLPPLKMFVQLALRHHKDMNSIYLLAARNSSFLSFSLYLFDTRLLTNNDIMLI